MKLNNVWGYGQLFGFSGLEGPNRYYDDCVLMTMKKKLELRYEFRLHYIKLMFNTNEKIKIISVMSDFIEAEIGGKRFVLTFKDNDTLVGVSPILPTFKGERKLKHDVSWGINIYSLDNHFLGFNYKVDDGLFTFVIHHSFTLTEARAGANHALVGLDIESILYKYKEYYAKLPKCKDSKYERLYYKALSVNKVNIHTPEGKIKRLWSTPDRVPHKHMWMWDSAFHAIAMVQYNSVVAKEIFLAMLEQMRTDGFMPHMANPTDSSDVTQPCIMSWAAYIIYKKTNDKDFLASCAPYLEKYLSFDMENRDKNHNGLLEWFTEPDYFICKCGESGLDNSPRFDFDQDMDCFDFSTYFAMDTHYLSFIFKELGNNESSNKWEAVSNKTASLINKAFWDEEDGAYYDALFDGTRTKVFTHTSFLPMLAGISSKEQAEHMVKTLFDKSLLYTEFPFASIAQTHPTYSNDMWRGASWLNIDYLIVQGLLNYGYVDLAKKVRDQVLEKVNKWYKKTGTIFEFYDSSDKTSPFMCHRKGDPLKKPDYRKHVHSISDYNWSACFTLLFIQEIYQ